MGRGLRQDAPSTTWKAFGSEASLIAHYPSRVPELIPVTQKAQRCFGLYIWCSCPSFLSQNLTKALHMSYVTYVTESSDSSGLGNVRHISTGPVLR